MNTIDEMISCLQAYKEGKKIESSFIDDDCWCIALNPCWDFYRLKYRVKREPREVWVNVYEERPIPKLGNVYPTQSDAKFSCHSGGQTVKFREVLDD